MNKQPTTTKKHHCQNVTKNLSKILIYPHHVSLSASPLSLDCWFASKEKHVFPPYLQLHICKDSIIPGWWELCSEAAACSCTKADSTALRLIIYKTPVKSADQPRCGVCCGSCHRARRGPCPWPRLSPLWIRIPFAPSRCWPENQVGRRKASSPFNQDSTFNVTFTVQKHYEGIPPPAPKMNFVFQIIKPWAHYISRIQAE